MKSRKWCFYLVAAVAGLTLLGRATPAFAAEDRGGQADRLDRLEQRLNEMASRQEQMMRQSGAQMDGRGPGLQPQSENIRNPMPQAGSPIPQASPTAKFAKDIGGLLQLLFLVGIICNILLAVWIFTDIRRRGEGSGIFVVLALVAGIPAAIIYSLTRIGDRKA